MSDKDRLCHALDVLMKPSPAKALPTWGDRVDAGVKGLLQAIDAGTFREAVGVLMMSVANDTKAHMEAQMVEPTPSATSAEEARGEC